MIPKDRIELNPRGCNGKPVIKGTRIPVSVILEQIAQGESWDDLLKGYPELIKEDIQAALLYASASIENKSYNFSECYKPSCTIYATSLATKI